MMLASAISSNFISISSVAALFAALMEPLPNDPKYPYKPARWVQPKGGGKHYIVFYIYSADCGKLIRKRDYEIDAIAPLARPGFAKKRIEQINELLKAGYHIDSRRTADQNDYGISKARIITTETALNMAMDKKSTSGLASETVRAYRVALRIFKAWGEKSGQLRLDVRKFDRSDAQSFRY